MLFSMLCVCMHVCVQACMRVCLCVCVCVCAQFLWRILQKWCTIKIYWLGKNLLNKKGEGRGGEFAASKDSTHTTLFILFLLSFFLEQILGMAHAGLPERVQCHCSIGHAVIWIRIFFPKTFWLRLLRTPLSKILHKKMLYNLFDRIYRMAFKIFLHFL